MSWDALHDSALLGTARVPPPEVRELLGGLEPDSPEAVGEKAGRVVISLGRCVPLVHGGRRRRGGRGTGGQEGVCEERRHASVYPIWDKDGVKKTGGVIKIS